MVHLDFGVVFSFVGFLSIITATVILNFKNHISMNVIIIISAMLGVAHLDEESAGVISKL
jgi:type IV secretory pathway VirB3-like protein